MKIEDKVRGRITDYEAAKAAVQEAKQKLEDARSSQERAKALLVKCIASTGKRRILYKGNEYQLTNDGRDQPDRLEITRISDLLVIPDNEERDDAEATVKEIQSPHPSEQDWNERKPPKFAEGSPFA